MNTTLKKQEVSRCSMKASCVLFPTGEWEIDRKPLGKMLFYQYVKQVTK